MVSEVVGSLEEEDRSRDTTAEVMHNEPAGYSSVQWVTCVDACQTL
jgi:hypothetical protein